MVRHQRRIPPIPLGGSSDVVNLLADTINKVRAGEMDLRVANCIGYLSGHLVKAFEIAEIERRIEVIERVVLKK